MPPISDFSKIIRNGNDLLFITLCLKSPLEIYLTCIKAEIQNTYIFVIDSEAAGPNKGFKESNFI